MIVRRDASAAVLAWRPDRRAVPAVSAWMPVAAMTLATALGAQVAFRLPWTPVPFTMQVFGVLLTGLLLDPRRALAAQVAYVGLGAAGLPWFAGLASLASCGATLGYLAGFVVAAPLVASLRPRIGPVAAGALGIAIIHALGVSFLARFPGFDPASAAVAGVLPFLPGDVAKLGLAVATARRLAA